MNKFNEEKTNKIAINLSPSTWIFILQGILLHYKITGILNIKWVYILLPFILVFGGTILWNLLGSIFSFSNSYYTRNRRK